MCESLKFWFLPHIHDARERIAAPQNRHQRLDRLADSDRGRPTDDRPADGGAAEGFGPHILECWRESHLWIAVM